MTSMRSPFKSIVTLCAVLLLASVSVRAANLPDFTELVKEHSSAVVNISTTQMVKQPKMQLPQMPDLPEGTPFGDLFRHFFGEGGEMEQRPVQSLGSGLIIDTDGYIITNHHVIKDADEIIVRLTDQRQLVAEVIGSDSRSDIALLKIDADRLHAVVIGDSDRLEVGAWVLAIGSPFGFNYSVTAGIVSAKGRSLPSENYVPFIQTDVAINPGNSGGPLFNLDGEVVGVNSQIYSRTGGFMGLSFAIPINVVMDVVEQIKATGHVSRGWLGVMIQDVTRELAEAFGMSRPHGALISKVLADSPAAGAGLRAGDIVLRFGGREVADSASLPPMVGRVRADSEVDVVVLRDGKELTVRVTIGELPGSDLAKAEADPRRDASDQRLGIKVTVVTDEVRQALDLSAGGVLVESIANGPAARAGVRPGDVIVMLNQQEVEGPEQFEELVDALPADRSIALRLQRSDGALWLALRLVDEH